MKNSEYWQERFKQLEEAQNKLAQKAFKEVEAKYRAAQRALEGKINTWYHQLANNNGISMAEARKPLSALELANFKLDVHDYIKYGKGNGLSGQWIKQLENASAKLRISKYDALRIQTQQSLENLFAKQTNIVSAAMKEVYQSGYYHTAFEVQKGFGVGWDILGIDQNQLEKVIAKPWAVDGKNFSERIWSNKQRVIAEVNNELTKNILLGADPKRATDSIAGKLNACKSGAGRLVMTEGAYFGSAAQKDCFEELGVEEYEVVATLDKNTSEICRSLDGKRFPVKEFRVGVTAPPFHPWCRSTVCPCFDDDFEERTEGYRIPADISYEEWEERFVEGDKEGLTEIDKSGNDGIIKNTEEMFRKKTFSARPDIKPINEAVFNGLVSNAEKKGAVIIRSEYGDEWFLHLEKNDATASCIGDTLIFRPDATVSEVLEEIHHFEQNLSGLNSDKDLKLRTILNEIEAKQFILDNAIRYSIPRNEIEEIQQHLKQYQQELDKYYKEG
ncbi:MAG: minor capsid protein [Ruminiclostridium sp.]|nr:minor capsid protein [Ruminiclostridium sp.]